MALPRAINDAHSAASDFFQNLIITYAPIGVTYLKFPEQVIKRFFLRWSCSERVTVGPVSAHPCGEHTAQTKAASDTRCGPAFGADSRLLLEVHRVGTGG